MKDLPVSVFLPSVFQISWYILVMKSQGVVFREYLNDYFSEVQEKNPRFSLRAFAKRLKLSPGALSQMLNGKRNLSEKMIIRICDELCISPEERETIFLSANSEAITVALEQSVFETLSSWTHDAYLSLLKIHSGKKNDLWYCKRIGISKEQLERVIENLLAVGLIKRVSGELVVCNESTQVFAKKKTSPALKKLQLEANSLSRMAIEQEDIQRRYHAINTLTIDPEKMDEAKEFLREFRRKFCSQSVSSIASSRVYQLNVSLYPVDQELAQ